MFSHGQASKSVDNPPISLLYDSLTAMRKLRIALIWMLMLALPAQSMAAIGMQLCALSQQSGALSQQMAAHHPGAMPMVQPADSAEHSAHHGGASSASSSASSAAKATPAGDNSLCSLCAFCVGAVALNNVLFSSPALQAAEPSLARLEHFAGFIAETPERPPRLFLA